MCRVHHVVEERTIERPEGGTPTFDVPSPKKPIILLCCHDFLSFNLLLLLFFYNLTLICILQLKNRYIFNNENFIRDYFRLRLCLIERYHNF